LRLSKEKKQKRKKGFIGSIGDDVPALIPIVISIVIFFSAFGYSMNLFNLKTDTYLKTMEAFSIARTAKGNNVISTFDDFNKACEKNQLSNSKFFYFLMDPEDLNEGFDVREFREYKFNVFRGFEGTSGTSPTYESDQEFRCYCYLEECESREFGESSVFSFIFPVVLKENFNRYSLKYLVVLVW